MDAKTWRVTWAINATGITAEDAAAAAFEVLSDPDGALLVLDVRQHDKKTSVMIEVDRDDGSARRVAEQE